MVKRDCIDYYNLSIAERRRRCRTADVAMDRRLFPHLRLYHRPRAAHGGIKKGSTFDVDRFVESCQCKLR